MKKTLLITLEYPPQIGGVANYYYNLVNNLPSEKIVVQTDQNHELLSNIPFLPWLKSFFSIKKQIIKDNIEVILVGQILPLGTIAWLLNKIMKIPYIVFTHAMDITVPQKSGRKKYLMKKILSSADKIITVSRYTKYEILKLLDNKNQRKIEIISPAPNITPQNLNHNNYEDFIRQFKNDKILLSVGRLVARKGHDRVIQSLPLLVQQKIPIKYIIIGNGPQETELVNLVKDLKLQRQVIFKHNLSDEEVAQYYQICDIFIMPSRETSDKDVEGFGLVYLEANSFGKPVIGGNSGGIADAIIDGKNGFLVEPNNIPMIVQAITKLLNSQQLMQKMGAFGKERVAKEFNWADKAKQLEAILS